MAMPLIHIIYFIKIIKLLKINQIIFDIFVGVYSICQIKQQINQIHCYLKCKTKAEKKQY